MNILNAIGNTSLVQLRNVVPPDCADVLVKLEWENPSSLKDRMALAVIAGPHASPLGTGADGRDRFGGTEMHKEMARRLAREEALFAGSSSGANVIAAIQVARGLGPGATVVTLMAGSGLKYLSTDVFRNASYAQPTQGG